MIIDWIKNNLDAAMLISVISIIIALVNTYIVYKKTKHNILKTLILDYNLKFFYEYFTNIKKTSEKLKSEDINSKIKTDISQELVQCTQTFRQEFIDLFFSVNQDLYKELDGKAQKLLDDLSNAIGDDGINLYIESKYNECIAAKIVEHESEMIKLLIDKCR